MVKGKVWISGQRSPLLSVVFSFISALLAFMLAILVVSPVFADDAQSVPSASSDVEVEYVEYEEPDWEEIDRTIESVNRLGWLSEKIQIGKAKWENYQTQSGAELLWAEATAHRYGEQKFVTVPLASQFKEVNQVIFTWADGKVYVEEVFGELLSDLECHVRVWIDGVLSVERYVVDNEPNIETRGISWSAFKNCLERSGLAFVAVGFRV